MTTESNEQYRAGFEAWYAPIFKAGEPANMPRRANGDYMRAQDQIAFMAWCAAMQQREASTEPSAKPVAYAVVAPKGGIHKLSITRESAERKMAKWLEEWPDNKCSVRPLAFADESGAGALSDDAKDAARWRAFVGSARIKPQGSAGLGEPQPNHYAHMGLEIWTTFDRDCSQKLLDQIDASTALGREWLTKYADIAVAAIEAHKTGSDHGQG